MTNYQGPLFEMEYPEARPSAVADTPPTGVLYVSKASENESSGVWKKRMILAGLIACCVILIVVIWRLHAGIKHCELNSKKNVTCDLSTTTSVKGACTPIYSCDKGIVESGVCVQKKKQAMDLFDIKDSRVVLSIALIVVAGIFMALVLKDDKTKNTDA